MFSDSVFNAGWCFPPHQQTVLSDEQVAPYWYLRNQLSVDTICQRFSLERFVLSPSGCQLQAQVVTCASDQPAINGLLFGMASFGMASSLGSVNLLEQLLELQTFHILDYWFIMKDYNSGTASWKRCIRAASGERVWCFHVLQACGPHPPPPVSVWSPTWKFSDPCLFGFLWRLHYTDMIKSLVIDSSSRPSPFPKTWQVWN